MAPDAAATPYARLSPDRVLAAVESLGLCTDGRLLALNSFENRVYQVGIADGAPIVAKFYRGGRWSDAAIAEEHAFAAELAAAELPVVAPLDIAGSTLQHFDGFRFALYRRQGGRAPELESADTLAWMGRLLARLHGIGGRMPFRARGRIDRPTFIAAPARVVLASPLLPPGLRERYRAAIDALDALLEGYADFGDFNHHELALIEPLRCMRQVHYAGWIAQRWDDPAFPRAFPFAAEARWWEQHVADLIEAAEGLESS
jgi:Ser/Thr protein kinase RdoA (MazF antagonist)